MKKLLYFGCIRQPGHYWFSEGESSIPYADRPKFPIDGVYVPALDARQGAAEEHDLEDCRIIAWHDYTGDHRPNSNSALVGFGYDSVEEMLKDAEAKFPTIMKRQTKPLNFKP